MSGLTDQGADCGKGDDGALRSDPHRAESSKPIVSLVIGAYKRPIHLAGLLRSIQLQTLERWEAIVVHETPCPEVKAIVDSIGDPRVRYIEMAERVCDWGNSCKELGSMSARGEWIGHSNDDNYYVPEYFRVMVECAVRQKADLVYCDMVHNGRQYRAVETAPIVGHIDGGGWLCRADLVRSTPWLCPKSGGLADGQYVELLVRRCRAVAKVRAVLFVHN